MYKVHKKLLRQWKWWQPRKCVKRKIVWLLLVRILKQYEMLSATSLKQLLVINTHFLIQREVKRVGILVVSTDRGMCGGLNINLFKTVMTEIKQWKDKGVTVELGLIGSKGTAFSAH